jgi:hypothetical protein
MTASTPRYLRRPDLRTRPIPQWGQLLVYTPAQPRLHWLNLNAWVILELCDGRSEDQLRAAYREMVEPRLSPEQAEQHLTAGLNLLQLIDVVVLETQERSY